MNCGKITFDKNCNIIVTEETFDSNYVQVFVLKNEESSQVLVRENESTQVIFSNNPDGYYTVCKLTIPLEGTYYYKDGKYYHGEEEITLQELINLNQEVSGIQIEYFYYFMLCKLKKCFINICQELFKQQNSICTKPTDSFLSYKKDLLWAAINTLEYLIEMDRAEEAQILLKELTECNGLCPSEQNCGCNG